jgi:hypothetical protein
MVWLPFVLFCFVFFGFLLSRNVFWNARCKRLTIAAVINAKLSPTVHTIFVEYLIACKTKKEFRKYESGAEGGTGSAHIRNSRGGRCTRDRIF